MKRQRVEDDKKTSGLRTIWFFLRDYKHRLALLVGLAILIGYLETLSIAVLYPILDASLDMEGGLSGNLFFRALNYLAGLFPVDSALVAYCILFILLVLLVFLCRLIYTNLSARTIAKIATDFKIKVFHKFTESDYQFFVDNRQGDLLYLAKGAPDSTGPALQALALSIVEIIMAVSVLVLLFSMSWKATIGVVVLGAAYYFFTRYLGVKISYVAGKEMKSASQDENAVLNEYISGAKQIIAFRTGSRWQQLFLDAVVIRWQFWAKNMIWKKIPPYVLETLLYASVAIIVIAIWALYPDKFLSLIPLLGTFAFAVFRILPRLSNTGTQLMQMMNLLPNLEVTRELLEDKTYNNIRNGTREFPTFQSSIEFKNIGFTHKNKDYVTLSDISLRVEKNRTTAIVGPSGAGKSTLVDLFLRLYDVDSGVILIDGMDIKDYELSSFLSKVGFVGQETFIYNASVKDNISFGADYDIDQIKEAAKQAYAHEFIEKLDHGYDTVVRDRGVRLSGGERQRIALARAMIRKPQILVLDEATSSLDNISERIVQNTIDKISEGCTTLVVAHRLSTIRNANVIYVIDSGNIVESGTHDQLITIKGKYWNLYATQSGGT